MTDKNCKAIAYLNDEAQEKLASLKQDSEFNFSKLVQKAIMAEDNEWTEQIIIAKLERKKAELEKVNRETIELQENLTVLRSRK